MTERIGVLGGTFNPIHIGHLAAAQTALEKMHLSRVIFVPSYIPPHKNCDSVANAHDRFQMVRLAIKRNTFFQVSDFEIAKKGKSYTCETMDYFYKKYPNDRLFFIIGEDTLPQLLHWRFIDNVLKVADFIVVNRPGQTKRKSEIKHFSVTMPGIDISSSYIRMRIKEKKSIQYFVPDKIIQYILRKKIYVSPQLKRGV